MIEVKNISKSYGDKLALNNVSFTVKNGGICGLIGANGAGKSTLLKIITGVLNADIKNRTNEVAPNGATMLVRFLLKKI